MFLYSSIAELAERGGGGSKGDEKVLEDTLFSSYFQRLMVPYFSVAELAERRDEKVLEDTLIRSYFHARWFRIPLLQNSLSEGESEVDEKLLEDTLFSSYFHLQMVLLLLYSSVAELPERGGE